MGKEMGKPPKKVKFVAESVERDEPREEKETGCGGLCDIGEKNVKSLVGVGVHCIMTGQGGNRVRKTRGGGGTNSSGEEKKKKGNK